MKPVYGNTLGIVVQNNDPQKRGRVKVFIPHMSLNLYDKWDNEPEDKSFSSLTDPYIKEILNEVKDRLPWANCAAPIVGENGLGQYNCYTSEINTETQPLSSPVTDHYNNEYSLSSYTNSVNGLFSVPNVGTKVWVFFENGDINHPVYFATSYNQSEWDTINENSGDYPDKLENYSKLDGEDSDSTYNNKMVISQKGGVIEIINTDNKESIKISQFNGSFKIWANEETNEFVANDRNTYIRGNSKETIDGNQDLYIGGNVNINVVGDVNLVVDGNVTETVKGDVGCNITGNMSATVKGDTSVATVGKLDVTSGGAMNLTAGGNMTLVAPKIDLNP